MTANAWNENIIWRNRNLANENFNKNLRHSSEIINISLMNFFRFFIDHSVVMRQKVSMCMSKRKQNWWIHTQ